MFVEGCCSGNPQRNAGIEVADGDYIYFLDDDNIPHPNFFPRLLPLLDGKQALVVNQVWPNGKLRLRADPKGMRVGGVDTAMVILPRYMVGETRWVENNYCADGIFFQEVYQKHKDSFFFLPENLAYYNYLS